MILYHHHHNCQFVCIQRSLQASLPICQYCHAAGTLTTRRGGEVATQGPRGDAGRCRTRRQGSGQLVDGDDGGGGGDGVGGCGCVRPGSEDHPGCRIGWGNKKEGMIIKFSTRYKTHV